VEPPRQTPAAPVARKHTEPARSRRHKAGKASKPAVPARHKVDLPDSPG
jgi:hypothetical protein